MVDPVSGVRSPSPTATQAAEPAHNPERARKFSSTLAAWMSRSSGLRTDHTGGDEHETPDPEPIKASAPIVMGSTAAKSK